MFKGSIHPVYNNCTGPEQTKNWKVDENVYETNIPNSESMRVVQTIEAMGRNIDENSQATQDGPEVDETQMSRSANVGALKDVDKSEFNLVAQFAELAVKTLDEIDPDNTKRVVLGITEAKKQVCLHVY